MTAATPEPSTLDQLREATDTLRAVAGRLLWTSHLEVDDLYRAGGSLTEATVALGEISRHLGRAVTQPRPCSILRDDQDQDPQQRMITAAALLDELARHLTLAVVSAQRYHSAISHIGEVTA